ncbi:hypothetical protein HHI36_022377 [Cryptolaemus montrouzieri]|uniref:Uncharacterized protein n=1 Tax=Cryptolaemus montrouzieri TaxID=559131 RepID=A0ABD2N017_9CUCU
MSELAVLDTIVGDVTTIKLAQATFSKQLDSCLEVIEAHKELISAHTSSIQTCSADIQSLKSDHAVLTTGFIDIKHCENKYIYLFMVDSRNIPDLQCTQASIKVDIARLEMNSKKAMAYELSEIIARVKRADNIIILNAPENVDAAADKSLVLDLISKIDAQAITSIVSIKCLGFRQTHPRPIKVEFHSAK